MYGALMAGANFVLSTTGYLEGALCQSYAKVALDGEQMRLHYKLGQGVDFDELDDAMAAIRSIEPGDHYLGTAQHVGALRDGIRDAGADEQRQL